jgi:chromatin segregation and condensation protein Rec8/ScpA/Scc1 (kleisin family)
VADIVKQRTAEGYPNPEEERMDLAKMNEEAEEFIMLAQTLVQKAQDGQRVARRKKTVSGREGEESEEEEEEESSIRMVSKKRASVKSVKDQSDATSMVEDEVSSQTPIPVMHTHACTHARTHTHLC